MGLDSAGGTLPGHKGCKGEKKKARGEAGRKKLSGEGQIHRRTG